MLPSPSACSRSRSVLPEAPSRTRGLMLAVTCCVLVCGLIAPASAVALPLKDWIVSGTSATRVVLINPVSHATRAVRIVRKRGDEVLTRTPDGRSLAQVELPHGEFGESRIWLSSLVRRRSTTFGPFPDSLFSLSFVPDSRRVAAAGRDNANVLPGPFKLELIDLEAGTAIALATYSATNGISGVRWSPDGTRIAFVHNHGPSSHVLTVIPAAGGVPMEIAEGVGNVAGRLDWAPDSAHIAFQTVNPSEDLPSSGIDVIAADGSGRRTVYGRAAFQPRWSPSGRYLAFLASSGYEPRSLAVLDTRSGRLTRLRLHLTARKAQFAWSPSVDELAVCGLEGFYLARPHGRLVRRVSRSLCPSFWEPDSLN
jgi:Tol biopolymer transport system component